MNEFAEHFFHKIPLILKPEVGFLSDRKSFSRIFENCQKIFHLNFISIKKKIREPFLIIIHHSFIIHHSSFIIPINLARVQVSLPRRYSARVQVSLPRRPGRKGVDTLGGAPAPPSPPGGDCSDYTLIHPADVLRVMLNYF